MSHASHVADPAYGPLWDHEPPPAQAAPALLPTRTHTPLGSGSEFDPHPIAPAPPAQQYATHSAAAHESTLYTPEPPQDAATGPSPAPTATTPTTTTLPYTGHSGEADVHLDDAATETATAATAAAAAAQAHASQQPYQPSPPPPPPLEIPPGAHPTWPLWPGEDESLALLLQRRHTRASDGSVSPSHTAAMMDTIRTSAWLFLTARGESIHLPVIESSMWIHHFFTRHAQLSQCLPSQIPSTNDNHVSYLDSNDSDETLRSASYVLVVAAAATGATGSEGQPTKRGRGRPRKNPLLALPPPPNPNQAPKRPRGRPKKVRPPQPPKIPKKRGRPPKNRAPAPSPPSQEPQGEHSSSSTSVEAGVLPDTSQAAQGVGITHTNGTDNLTALAGASEDAPRGIPQPNA